MNCTEYLALLHDHFMGKLPAQTMARIDAHAASCAACGALMARAKELSCREFTAFLNDYIDDALPPERRAIFERHLEICVDCRNYLQSYRETMEMSALACRAPGKLPEEPIPDALVLAILRAGSKGKESS
jgi:anti-sigma factor RsiW